MPKVFSFIVTALEVTLKSTQQVSKKIANLKRKGQETLIIHRNQVLRDTSKICFDTFRPVNVVNSDLNHSLTSNISAISKFSWFEKWSSLIFQVSVHWIFRIVRTIEKAKTNHLRTFESDR